MAADIPDYICERIINGILDRYGSFLVLQMLNDPQKNVHRLHQKYNMSVADIVSMNRVAYEYRLAVKSSIMDNIIERMNSARSGAA